MGMRGLHMIALWAKEALGAVIEPAPALSGERVGVEDLARADRAAHASGRGHACLGCQRCLSLCLAKRRRGCRRLLSRREMGGGPMQGLPGEQPQWKGQ